ASHSCSWRRFPAARSTRRPAACRCGSPSPAAPTPPPSPPGPCVTACRSPRVRSRRPPVGTTASASATTAPTRSSSRAPPASPPPGRTPPPPWSSPDDPKPAFLYRPPAETARQLPEDGADPKPAFFYRPPAETERQLPEDGADPKPAFLYRPPAETERQLPGDGAGAGAGTVPGMVERLGTAGTMPIAEAAGRHWDSVVVGAGHNGLTAAAYLARAGRSVLVLERRAQIGGACTLETPFPDERFVTSPCAYLVGLLHPLVVDELGLHRRGYRVQPVDPHLWCPFDDGTALALWDDPARTAAAVAAIAPGDVEGYLAYEALFGRIRRALRADYTEATDTWLGPSPTRAELEARLGHDPELVEVLFDTPIADVIERHVADERLRTALHGQGIIGTFAGPRDPGTAAVYALHSLGTIEGRPGAWGYVEGGMGRISLALAEAATEAGAVVLT